MNKFFETLATAKSNPHVFWPLVICMGLRVALPLSFGILNIYAPGLKDQNHQVQELIEPYLRGAYTALTTYATFVAAKSGPVNPEKPNP